MFTNQSWKNVCFQIDQVQIRHDELDSFIRAAKHLQVFDVGEDGEEHDDAITTTTTTAIAKQECKISSRLGPN